MTYRDIPLAAGCAVLALAAVACAAHFVAEFVTGERARAQDRRRHVELVGPPTVTDEPLEVNYCVEAAERVPAAVAWIQQRVEPDPPDAPPIDPTVFVDDDIAATVRRVHFQ